MFMILYFDTETSGLHPGQIVQLSYVMQSGESAKSKNFFFTVDNVEYGALAVHGFSVETLKKLSGGKRFSFFIEEIEKDFSLADVVVSHNTAFDFMFMREEFIRLGKTFYTKNEFCLMKNLTPICKLKRSNGAYKYPKLQEACEYFGITDTEIKQSSKLLFGANTDFHDARFDTTAVYLVCNYAMEKEPTFWELKNYL